MQRILVVEDDPAVLQCSRIGLINDGYDAIGASSLEEARMRLRANWYDLVLIDYQLPAGRTGLELLALLRDLYPEIPAILVSGSREPGLEHRALELGAVGFLAKPYDLRLLKKICKDALSPKKREVHPVSSSIPRASLDSDL
jgi:DNA-binding NtrC family response regulator